MKKSTFIFLLTICSFTNAFSQVKAVTENGEKVLLYSDGTWKSANQLDINLPIKVLPTPSFNGNTLKSTGTSKHQLSISKSTPNEIIDDEKWFAENDLSLPTYEVPNTFRNRKGNVPDNTPRSYEGKALVMASYSETNNFLVYGNNFGEGRYLIITNKEMTEVQHVLDFQNYIWSPDYIENDRQFIYQRIRWVELEDNVLYVSHSHMTYAESSKGMNAYITAIDLNTMNVIWRSQPLVSNTANFELLDDIIVTGYGFTKEPDYLYTLEKKTGAVVQKIKVKTGPEVIIKKGDKLFVRAYDTNYEINIR